MHDRIAERLFGLGVAAVVSLILWIVGADALPYIERWMGRILQ